MNYTMKLVMRLAAIAGLALSVLATTASGNVVKVILLGGQSNAVGQGNNSGLPTSPVNLQLPQDDVLFYYTGGGGLTTLRSGSGGVTMGSEAKFGVEVTFGREIADANPSVTYAIIKHAESGTALYNDWAPGTGPSYTAFRNTVAAGLAALQNAGYTTEIVGMLWHQGESDALEGQQANYANNLTAFIADIRSRYGANLPFLIGEIRQNGGAYNVVVNTQSAIAAADPFARFVPATDLSFYDFFHFDAAGLITLGERFATAFLDLVSNESVGDVTIASGFSGSFTAVNSPTDSAYEGDQSATDLLNELPATVATGWNLNSGSTVAELNDGIHGAFPGGDAEGTWSNEGAVAEYNLGPNAAGYDITSIQSIASWVGAGFGNQVWTVEVKPVGGSYVLLATVDYTPFNNTGGATKVNLTGLDATGIESIRFTAGSTAGNSSGNDFVIREIDVEGTATPTVSDVTIASGFSGSFTAVSDSSDSAYEGDQSASDLLNELTATVASVGWTFGGGATLPELNDGIHGAFPGGDAEGTWSNEGAIAEYNLGPNAAGYDITSIQSIASWTDSGFGNQVWTVEVKPVGGSYALLATVDYTPLNNAAGATKVNLTGLDATGIESIRFTAGSTAGNSVGNNFVIREIDVLGAATPQGTIVQSNTTYAAYADLPVSNSDLVNYGQPTLGSYTVSATSDSDETPDRGFITGTAGSNFSDITWFRGDNGNDQLPGTITLNLDVSVNTAGYDISQIISYAGYIAGLEQGDQIMTVEYSVAGDAGFTTLGTYSYEELGVNQFGSISLSHGTDTYMLTGVDALRFTYADPATADMLVLQEIDVLGVATPQGGIVQSNTTYAAYADLPVSNSDLVNYGQPTLDSYTVSATSDSDETPDRGFITGTAGSNFSDITWFRGDNGNDQLPGTITLNLDVSVNTAGYDISQIISYAGYIAGLEQGDQIMTVEYSVVGDAGFTTLGTYSYEELGVNQFGSISLSHDTDTYMLTGVDALRFTYADPATADMLVLQEIDVLGVATPNGVNLTSFLSSLQFYARDAGQLHVSLPVAGDVETDDITGPADGDGDGVADDVDAFPNNPDETADTDGDGVGDNKDIFPNDENLTTLSDYVDFMINYVVDDRVLFETDWRDPVNEADFVAGLEAVLELVLAAEAMQDTAGAVLLYSEALAMVDDVLIPRTDGFHGGSLENDWIIIKEAQDIVHPDLVLLSEHLFLMTR